MKKRQFCQTIDVSGWLIVLIICQNKQNMENSSVKIYMFEAIINRYKQKLFVIQNKIHFIYSYYCILVDVYVLVCHRVHT